MCAALIIAYGHCILGTMAELVSPPSSLTLFRESDWRKSRLAVDWFKFKYSHLKLMCHLFGCLY